MEGMIFSLSKCVCVCVCFPNKIHNDTQIEACISK